MKKVFLILGLAALVTSCSLNDDDGQNVNIEYAKITNVELPDTLVIGNRYSFPITSEINDCSSFYGFQVDPTNPTLKDSIRYVGALNRVVENANCGTSTDTISNNLNFEVLFDYSYTFKFLTDFDANDKPIYLTKVIPVKARQ
jgi:ABC-type enterochelin transport system substrate-binding protein